MRCPSLSELPPPPPGKTGWPWTEESPPIAGGDAARWPRVSVIVPSYQQGRFIEETLRSVLLQGYPDLELIVMDGGSSDETVSILQRYDRWITSWVSAKDGGQSAAVNAGWRKATGAFLSWLNSDDLLMPGWAARAVPVMVADPGLDFTYNDVQIIDVDSRPQWVAPGVVPDLEGLMVRWSMPFAHMGCLMRREVLESCGYLRDDLHFAMDAEYVVRLLSKGRRFGRIEGVNGAFRLHDAGKTSNNYAVMIADMVGVTEAFCASAPPELSGLVARARRRCYWNVAHIGYDNHDYLRARQSALRHLADNGVRALPRVTGMVSLSLLGERGRQVLRLWRKLRAPRPA